MSSPARAAARQELHQLLQLAVSAAANVPSGQPDDLGGQSPVIIIASGGSNRPRLTMRGSSAMFYLDVYVFVRATDDADDLLDLAEQQIAEALVSNQDTAHWMAVDYAGRSTTRFITPLDGNEYKLETIPLQLTAKL